VPDKVASGPYEIVHHGGGPPDRGCVLYVTWECSHTTSFADSSPTILVARPGGALSWSQRVNIVRLIGLCVAGTGPRE